MTVEEAMQLQKDLCEKKNIPHFAPMDGICYGCKRNIYKDYDMGHRISIGYITMGALEYHLITMCPHCHRSFCD